MTAGPVEILREATPEAVTDINRLLAQLSPTMRLTDMDKLQSALDAAIVFVIRADDHIVGTASLIVAPLPGGVCGYLESVVVDDKHRGQGIGEQLVNAAMEIAAQSRVTRIDLTTSDRRPAAKRLYQKLGFIKNWALCNATLTSIAIRLSLAN